MLVLTVEERRDRKRSSAEKRRWRVSLEEEEILEDGRDARVWSRREMQRLFASTTEFILLV